MGIYCFKSDRFRFLYFLVYEVYTKSNVRIQFPDFCSRLNWPKFQSWTVLNNLSENTDGAAVWRHNTEKSGHKAATFENNFAQSSQLAEKNAFSSFSFSSFAEN